MHAPPTLSPEAVDPIAQALGIPPLEVRLAARAAGWSLTDGPSDADLLDELGAAMMAAARAGDRTRAELLAARMDRARATWAAPADEAEVVVERERAHVARRESAERRRCVALAVRQREPWTARRLRAEATGRHS